MNTIYVLCFVNRYNVAHTFNLESMPAIKQHLKFYPTCTIGKKVGNKVEYFTQYKDGVRVNKIKANFELPISK